MQPESPCQQALEVFFSYSHKDEELRDRLETHLSILKRQGLSALGMTGKLVPVESGLEKLASIWIKRRLSCSWLVQIFWLRIIAMTLK